MPRTRSGVGAVIMLLGVCVSVPHAAGQTSSRQVDQRDPPGQGAEPPVSDPGPTVVVRGFGDVQWIGESAPGSPNTFRLGQLAGFVNARLSDRVSLLLEVVVEQDDDGEFFTDLERLHIDVRVADWLDLKLGRYHTNVGYYNTAFHHGQYFATAATRPMVFAFEDEGGPLPMHDLGIAAQGRIPGGLGLRYVLALGNGQRWTEEEPLPHPSAIDRDSDKSFNAGMRVTPDRVPGLEVGASFYRGRISGPDASDVASRVVAAHVVFVRPAVEVLAEAVWMRHAWPQAAPVDNGAFYVQASKRWGMVRPYVRYERTRLDRQTPLIGALRSRIGPTIGLRIDPIAGMAIKVQGERLVHLYPKPVYRGLVQVAFAF